MTLKTYRAYQGILQGLLSVTPPPGPPAPGSYKPDATTTGVPSGTTLATRSPLMDVNGDITLTVPGTIVDSLYVPGRILSRAANCIVRKSEVVGNTRYQAASYSPPPSTKDSALIDANSQSNVNLLIEDSELHDNYPAPWLDGVIGHDYTIRRCNIHSVVDGLGIYNSNSGHTTDLANVTVEANYIHDLNYIIHNWDIYDYHTHNDGIQIQGNGGVSIVGNTIQDLQNPSTITLTVPQWYVEHLKTGTLHAKGATYTYTLDSNVLIGARSPYYPAMTGQAIGFTPNVSFIKNVTIDKNWLDGGAQSITAVPNSFGLSGGIVITNNKFGRNQPVKNINGVSARRPIVVDPSLTVVNFPTVTAVDSLCGNVYEDDGSAITIYRTTG